MTNQTTDPSVIRDQRIQALDDLHAKAQEAGIETTLRRNSHASRRGRIPGFLHYQLPVGRNKRAVAIRASEAELILPYKLESLNGIEDYNAIVDRSSSTIEASLVHDSDRTDWTMELLEVPGVQVDTPNGPKTYESISLDYEERLMRRSFTDWRLTVEKAGRRLEISQPTDLAKVFLRTDQATIKLIGFDVSTHDLAKDALLNFANSFLFDIDVRYGVSLQIGRRRRTFERTKSSPHNQAPAFPRNKYSQESLALYQYGCAADNLPLLQFLAFYQSVEYFFPVFARQNTVSSMRSALLHPKFDVDDDANVNRLINIAAPAVHSGAGEKEQLRSTVRSTVQHSDLVSVIESTKEYAAHFCDKKQSIKGAKPLVTKDPAVDLRDQVADRLYKIRCRVVHTKQDGSGLGEDLLLPTSPEVDSLGPDIELLRMIAQNALIARAQRNL